jgi:hypothetical protein
MARWSLPEPIPVDWQMRTLDSAGIFAGTLPDGRFRQTVEHAPLPGVDPTMCLWYLEHVDQTLTWRGHTALAYRFWHPRDHIFFQRLGPFGAGDRWHIVEAFGRDRRFLLDEVFDVTKVDETGFRMELRRFGGPIVIMDERWRTGPDGLLWRVEMTVGTTRPVIGGVLRRLLRFRMPFLVRWRQHNVEEAGNLPHFLPELYTDYAT